MTTAEQMTIKDYRIKMLEEIQSVKIERYNPA